MSEDEDRELRPTKLRLRRGSRLLELSYADGRVVELGWEFLRVHSPSAEVRGHHASQAVLQTGKRRVAITDLKIVGHYALQIIFDDGHDSGLYSWEYLDHLGRNQDELWETYLGELNRQGGDRDPDTQVLKFQP
ncbi:MAG: gamma-butyrobetaine hydroxylase-like domain-containing protein [Pseudomonadota bacterium]